MPTIIILSRVICISHFYLLSRMKAWGNGGKGIRVIKSFRRKNTLCCVGKGLIEMHCPAISFCNNNKYSWFNGIFIMSSLSRQNCHSLFICPYQEQAHAISLHLWQCGWIYCCQSCGSDQGRNVRIRPDIHGTNKLLLKINWILQKNSSIIFMNLIFITIPNTKIVIFGLI